MTTKATTPRRATAATGDLPELSARSTATFVGRFFRAYPGRTFLMIALLVFAGVAEGVGLVALLPLVQTVVTQTSDEIADSLLGTAYGWFGISATLGIVLGSIVVLIAMKALFLWLAMRQVGYTAAMVATELRQRLIHALTFARWSHFAGRPAGHLTEAMSAQASRSATAYSDACATIADLIQVFVYLVIVLFVSPLAALLAVFGGALMVVLYRPFIKMTRSAGADQTRSMRTVVARLTELLAEVKPVKAMGREDDVWPLLERETQEFQTAQRRVILARESVSAFHEPIAVTLIAAGLYAALTYADLPVTELVVLAIIFYRLMTKASQVQGRYQTLLSNESAYWALVDEIQAAEEAHEQQDGGTRSPELRDGIELEGLSIAFGDKVVLTDLNARFAAGEFIALSGPSGAGKTTLADIIMGLLQPDAGRVLIDGVPLTEIDKQGWRSGIGYVPQDVLLFHDTVRANVTLGKPGLDDDDVRAALHAAGAEAFVDELPGGLDYSVGEHGARISGGQRQRIAIARAVVARPRLLVLDEATAALDPSTEAGILTTLLALRPAVTIVAISHGEAVARVADRVITVHT